MQVFNQQSTKENRRRLKNQMTEAEEILWNSIRRDTLGVRFRRQFGIGNYIVDFYCPSKKLVIEIDGSQHYTDDGLGYDKVRDEFIGSLRIRIIRFRNKEILKDLAGVMEKIKTVLSEA